MTEVEKSLTRIQRRRMPLHMVGISSSGYDLRDTNMCVFYFGDEQFILRPITIGFRGLGRTHSHSYGWKAFFTETSKQSTTFYLEF